MRPVCTVIFLTGLLALPLATKAMAVEVHESIFIQAVKVPDLRDTQASLSFGVLAFDFSQATESVYMFTQQIHTDPFLGLELSTQDITGAGRLILKSNGMGLGEIALRDLVIKRQGHPGPGPAQMPPLVITQVRPDGTTENSGKALAEAILLLLPVTGAEIVLGKSTKQPRRFPVIFLNQKSEATGERTVTAQRHVLYKDKLCVLFTVHDTLLQLVPAIPDASVDIRGEGYFLYEYQTKSILVSKLALRMRLLHFNETKVDSDNYYSVDRIP